MSYNTDLQSNNAELEEILDAVNTLPDAGSGGEAIEPVIDSLTITENGTYTSPDGVDGYSPVTVNVPIPDGYIVPNGTKEITENGTYDVEAYELVNVNVPIETCEVVIDNHAGNIEYVYYVTFENGVIEYKQASPTLDSFWLNIVKNTLVVLSTSEVIGTEYGPIEFLYLSNMEKGNPDNSVSYISVYGVTGSGDVSFSWD